MRIKLVIDSATTTQVRQLAVSLLHLGHTNQLLVGCDGPEHWYAETPPLEDYKIVALVQEL